MKVSKSRTKKKTTTFVKNITKRDLQKNKAVISKNKLYCPACDEMIKKNNTKAIPLRSYQYFKQ